MENKDLNVLWRPSSKIKEESNLNQFIKNFVDEFKNQSDVKYEELWKWSIEKPEKFWDSIWDYSNVLGEKGEILLKDKDKMPGARFFPNAKLNYTENVLKNKNEPLAIISEREDGLKSKISTLELKDKVLKLAGWLKENGISKGDRVCAYMPNCPETIITMLATASLGAVFSSCSTDFGVAGVLDRFQQIEPKILVTVDGYLYNGKAIERHEEVHQIVQGLNTLQNVLILKYLNENHLKYSFSYKDFDSVYRSKPLENFTKVNFNDPLYIVFSSGTTGAPKCIVHGVGGVLLQHAKEHKLHANIHKGDRVFYFSTCGWMMWNWLLGALFSEATIILYEGSPFYGGPNKLWDLAEKEKINLFGTSAKYIDAVRKSGYKPNKHNQLKFLKCLCSTGSPLSPESFDFINKFISSEMQIGSISGGTDILSCFVLNNPLDEVISGEIQCRGLGMAVDVFDEEGNSVTDTPGELVCTKPFPSMPIMFWNDPDGKKYQEAYFDYYPNVWRHGDWTKLTKRGTLVIFGRSDATLNPGGVRIGTAEIYKVVESFEQILESIVIGQEWEDDIRIVLFVKLKEKASLDEKLKTEIKNKLRQLVSPRHVPAKIISVADIPRTRSGKITELAVRDIIHGKKIKNIEALSNPEALDLFKDLSELNN
tara:strand:- start:718 stop:2673 length:1956 start_codon:yes stop_codon:yes gene_type:complete